MEDDFEMGDGSLGSEDEEEQEEGGKLTLEERRQKRAGGDHPLQESFRDTAGSLMQKYGLLGRFLTTLPQGDKSFRPRWSNN